MRKLDKFQQFVKDGEYDSDLSIFETNTFIRRLAVKRVPGNELCELLSNIEGSLDMSKFVEWWVSSCGKSPIDKISEQARLHTNKLIKTTLEEIEDIEDVNKMEVEPEDCMDIHHKEQELNQ